MNKGIVKVQDSQQRQGIGLVQHGIQGMLAEAHNLKKHCLLPSLSPPHSYTDSNLNLPNSPFNNQLHSILHEPLLKYRRINRNRQHYAITYRDGPGISRGKGKKSKTISVGDERQRESMSRVISRVERELLERCGRKKSQEVGRGKRKSLVVSSSDVPKYYLTITERDIECGRKSLERHRKEQQPIKTQAEERKIEASPSTSKATIESEVQQQKQQVLPFISSKRRHPLKQRIRSVMLRPQKRQIEQSESDRYPRQEMEDRESNGGWAPWQTSQIEQQQLPYHQQ